MPDKTLIVIAGPTAIGKTDLAIKLANYYNTEIISADSRQFYKEMEIGTAKPSPDELSRAKHHFINSHSITENFSVGDFEVQALQVIQNIFDFNDTALLVGGSGLYIKAITEGFDDLPKGNPDIRNELNQLLETEGIEVLQKKLLQYDPVYYSEVDINNPQRVIRALEVYMETGKPFSSFRSGAQKKRPFRIIKIGLNIARDALYNRINLRVDQMVKAGLIDEVKELNTLRGLNALNTVGYAELFEYFDGKKDLHQAIEQIKQNTRRFAKRQLTWFNKDSEIKWFAPSQTQSIIDYISENT